MPLTPKQQRFVEEYLIDLNATQAAIRAGYAKNSAHVTAARLLRNAKVQSAISKARAEQTRRTQIEADRVLEELARIAFSDVRGFFDGSRLKQIDELDDAAAASVAAIEIVTRPAGDGEVEYVHKIRAWDKVSALDKLMKHLGEYAPQKHKVADKDGCDHNFIDEFSRRIDGIASRASKEEGTRAPNGAGR